MNFRKAEEVEGIQTGQQGVGRSSKSGKGFGGAMKGFRAIVAGKGCLTRFDAFLGGFPKGQNLKKDIGLQSLLVFLKGCG